MIKVYREDEWIERHTVGKPDKYLLGFGLHAVSWENLKEYALNLQAWRLYKVYDDFAYAVTYYTRGKMRANVLRIAKRLEWMYWRYFIWSLLDKYLHLVSVQEGEMFSWRQNFLPFVVPIKLWKYGVIWE